MQTTPVTTEDLRTSVIAVPPLARNADYSFNAIENERQIKHIEAGGVTTLLYGGNANFYHIPLSEYETILTFLTETPAPDTLVIPSVGPAFGTMMDQLEVLKDYEFPTVMVLPQQASSDPEGIVTGFRKFSDALGKPVVLYIKNEFYLAPEDAQRLVDDGVLSYIKYAVIRKDPREDEYLSKLTHLVDPSMIVDGICAQISVVHMRDFGLTGFTDGCVCIRPELVQQVLKANLAGDFEKSETILKQFQPLEDLRNSIHPTRVLHDAVTASGIADMGPILPLFSNLPDSERDQVQQAVNDLLQA